MLGISQMQLRAKAWFKSYKKFELSIQPDAGHQKDSSSVTVLSSSCVQSRKKLIGDELQSMAGTRFQFSERFKKLIGGFCETWFCPNAFSKPSTISKSCYEISEMVVWHTFKRPIYIGHLRTYYNSNDVLNKPALNRSLKLDKVVTKLVLECASIRLHLRCYLNDVLFRGC